MTFSLGFSGEYWNDTLACLVIPAGEKNIVVAREPDGWMVLLKHDDMHYDNLLMAAAMVHHILATLQSRVEDELQEAGRGDEAALPAGPSERAGEDA